MLTKGVTARLPESRFRQTVEQRFAEKGRDGANCVQRAGLPESFLGFFIEKGCADERGELCDGVQRAVRLEQLFGAVVDDRLT